MTPTATLDATRPNLFVVGAAKSATTALGAHLGAHPDIFMSELKELPGLSRVVNRLVRGALRERVDRAFFDFEKPLLDPELRRRLRDVYAPHDARLRELLGRPLHWEGRE